MKTITIGAGAAVALSASIAVIGAQQAPAIPLRTGLTVVTAIHQDVGDFESIKRVTAVNNENIELSFVSLGNRRIDIRMVRFWRST